ncbi:hypothetical protein HMPREF1991_03240 [Hoylesella loescheii DSM 19665 = JCM 12249 = ATCC 15930]|uniref:Uncharacterized protein n=1 Tax=Hoylesella loescheii DSM 19665 = JCM 12249 = ATCC 15930 TaxID=1122985 RepID=A0A069QDL8_HOYLO|nr:hypothetical protein HMPREF1991_03240 [Hoylesella loescheii DSM 19665 = JCM 12249 = ATCC 15930]
MFLVFFHKACKQAKCKGSLHFRAVQLNGLLFYIRTAIKPCFNTISQLITPAYPSPQVAQLARQTPKSVLKTLF